MFVSKADEDESSLDGESLGEDADDIGDEVVVVPFFDELGDEEAREVAAIAERYAEVKPHTTAAAIVFALTRSDADGWNN